ncbi:hypothetical protein [Roseiconus lacunae]|uniref:hypothetical protein n=1 Tax=Roseiconus lacunae TaxID=2605694 RepID=UPI00135BBF71|nr:hypothetical protein [Roseiconus lacunae]
MILPNGSESDEGIGTTKTSDAIPLEPLRSIRRNERYVHGVKVDNRKSTGC